MYELVIYNNKNGQKHIKLEYASNFYKRLIGLMFKNTIKPLLFIQKTSKRHFSSIHTFFMKKTIDILYIREDNKILEYVTLPPWKIYTPKNNQTKYIIELPKNTLKKNKITTNTTIEVVKRI